MNTAFFKRPLSLILAVIMVIGLVPFSVNTAAGATTLAQSGNATKVADPSTMNDWTRFFGPSKLTTENAGGVWTDKSVFTDASAFTGTGISMLDEDGFLVALSAIASNLTVEGMSYVPTDTMLILDVSGSMNNNNGNNALADEMVTAANQSIDKLLKDNKHNRVGVAIYSGTSSSQTNSDASVVLLPLGRYTTGTSGEYLTYTLDKRNDEYISVNSNVVIEGTNTKPSSDATSKEVVGATYIQKGVASAVSQFLAQAGNTTVTDPVLGTLERIPVVVLMSDGAPTLGSTNFTAPGQYNLGTGSDTEAYLGFVTQLTLAYAKTQIDSVYGDSLFYTLGLGVGNDSIAKSVLNPSSSSTAINDFWTAYNNAAVGDEIVVYSETIEVEDEDDNNRPGRPGGNRPGDDDDENVTEETVTYSVTKIDTPLSQNYVDEYFAVDGTSTQLAEGLLTAFENIVNRIELQSSYFPTLVEKNEHLSGYVSFVDKIGKYMKVTDFKGILISNQLHTGRAFASHLTADGGNFGTPDNPTALGSAFFNSVKERLGLTDDQARTLIELAYDNGQLAYNAATGEYSNYIGWYADANGDFLGFWHEGIETMSPNAATIVKSYGYLGEVDEAHGVTDSDMMYATVRVMEDIATGDQTVAFAIPASLIPTVNYKVSLSDTGVLTNLGVTGATSPIRLVYEIALDSAINEITVAELATNSEYVAHHINKNGDYEFFTNKYDHDLITAYGTNNAYSYFRPSTQNDRYYYTSDSTIYIDHNGTAYTGATAPSSAGTYYRGIKVYSQDGTLQTKTVYEKISPTSLAKATKSSSGNTWYIPAGTVHTYIENFNTPKTSNNTNTLTWSDIPFVDSRYTYYVGAVLGNNGRITLTPATGIKISKTVAQVNTATGANTSFEFVVTNKTNTADASTYKSYHVDASGKVTESTVKFTAGKATVTLKDGEKLYISGMTAGNVINVTETQTEYYFCANSSVDITVNSREIGSADFVNTARGTGNLTVAKSVSHELGTDYVIPAGKKFAFTVTLSGISLAGKTFTAKHSGDTTVNAITVGADGSFSFTLGHDEEFEVYGLPEGTVATVVEATPGEGFTALYTDNNGGSASDEMAVVIKSGTTAVLVTNKYTPGRVDPVNITVSGTKTLEGRDWLDSDEFKFELQKLNDDGATWTTLATETVKGTDAEKSFSFSDVFGAAVYDKAGMYYYRISEIEGSVKGMNYDRTIHAFAVMVGDADMDGKLEIIEVKSESETVSVSYDGDSWNVSASFKNVYDLKEAVASIDITKLVTNESKSANAGVAGFKFELYENGNLVATSNETTDRGFTRLNLTFSEEGEHTYILKEAIPDSIPAGWTYSDAEITIKVKVVANEGTGELVATFEDTNTNSTSATFTNVYDPADATLNIDVRKTLSGRDLNDGEFSFILTDESGAEVETVQNTAGGDVPFETLTFTAVGRYEYYVSEVIPADADKLGGVTYDTSVHKIVVTVVDNGGTLSASYVVEDTAENYIVFANTYKADPVDYTVEGTKVLKGRVLINDEFGFTLTSSDAYGNIANGASVLEARNFSDGSFKFESLKFTAPGTYYYVVAEKQENTALGVIYDTTEYLVQINVKDNLSGNLEVESVNIIVKLARVNTANEIVFTNVYVPTPTSGSISGNKNYTTKINGTIESLDLSKMSFTFNLYHSDEKWTVGEHIQAVHNDAEGNFSFDTLDFTTAGTYYYVVSEVSGGEVINGIVYDSTVYRIKIEVTDNLTGALSAKISIYDNNDIPRENITFSNSYKITENAQAVIKGNKILHGLSLEADNFSFILKDESGAEIETVKNDANGKFEFTTIPYTATGTYVYTVEEVNGGKTLGGITYDATVYTITVKVTDNGSGTLVAEVSGAESIVFTNTYKAESAKVSVSGTKTLIGRELKDGDFSFTLIDSNGGIVETVSNAADGSFGFTDLEFTAVGEYTYTVNEVVGFAGGITYDRQTYTIVITVTDNGEGQLIAKVTLGGNDVNTDPAAAVSVSGINFENTYNAKSVQVSFDGIKTLVGRNLKVGEFSFILKDSDGGEIETVTNNADGTFFFSALTFDKAGTFTYTISEVKGSVAGITYDERVYNVIVEVTDNGEGNFVASITVGDEIAFKNTYNATDAEVHFSGIKKLTGRPLKAGEFRFTLTNITDPNNIEVIETVTNDAAGNFEFHGIEFKAPGTYVYTINEVKESLAGITYDETVYTITVTVTEDTENAKFIATVSENASSVKFENIYTAEGTGAQIGGIKKLEGREMKAGEFSFILKDASGSEIQTVKNNADGSFTFDSISYDTAGTYLYTVSELKGSIAGIKYDENIYTVEVVVEDNGLGKLTATVKGAESIVFTNTYTAVPCEITFDGIKTLSGRELKEGEFSFTLTDTVTNNVIETVTNSKNGSFAFSKLTFTKVGVYTYKIAEFIGTLANIEYDTKTYSIIVTVTDVDTDGKLECVVEGAGNIVFNNKFNITPVHTEISGTKTLKGRDLEAGEFFFTLTDITDPRNAFEVETVSNNAAGSFSFSSIEYKEAGTYRYTVTEVNNSIDGITYDESVYNITVTVTRSQNDVLSVKTEGAENIRFENVFGKVPVMISVRLTGKKTLIGRELKDGEFRFYLKTLAGQVIGFARNDENGEFIFTPVSFSEIGTHTFYVSEEIGDEDGMVYDDTVHPVTIIITRDEEGELVATVDGESELHFINVYSDPEETTETPEETTETPEETTEAPEETTETPEETTETPEETTETPEETTETPEETTETPEETTETPEETTETPEETTETPEETTETPEETTKTPEETTSPEETDQPQSPDTGDRSDLIIWVGAVFVAFCTTAGVLFSKKRDTDIDE